MSKFKSASTVVVFLAALFIGAIAAPTAGAYPGDYGCSSNEVGFYSDVSCRDQFGRRTTRDRASRVGNLPRPGSRVCARECGQGPVLQLCSRTGRRGHHVGASPGGGIARSNLAVPRRRRRKCPLTFDAMIPHLVERGHVRSVPLCPATRSTGSPARTFTPGRGGSGRWLGGRVVGLVPPRPASRFGANSPHRSNRRS